MMKVRDLRKSYIDYFVERKHRHVHSSPLIPKDDPTLLFTTAGMVQFKAMFAGTVKLEYTRAATVQKCLRTSDLENVGRTKRHCTFFEMLGNFSFGDYFKKEAIEWAWDYSTKVLGFDKEKLWASIFENDDEAFEIWNKVVGLPAERIVRLGKKDNFWGPAGDSGACGPCSELYIDKGPEHGCGAPDCKPGCDCERYMEYWNLVFNQFFQDTDGVQHPLPQTGIDTGMGLERLATIAQGVSSIYETDELKSLVDFVCRELKIEYKGDTIVPVNVIVEHSRALVFAMSDGAYPSNEGRGYVLRRILRRALRFTRSLGVKEPFVYKMVDPIVALMGEFYPEIVDAARNVRNVLEGEEKRFLETIENGMQKLEEIMQKSAAAKTISGADAFTLYDTYGFPVEMTNEMALERGLTVNMQEFEAEMRAQKERGRQSWKGVDNAFAEAMTELSKTCGASTFIGYEKDSCTGSIQAMSDGESIVAELPEGMKGYVVLKETPFYAEGGGQAGDRGVIISGGSEFAVHDTKKVNGTYIHHGVTVRGCLRTGENAQANVDVVRRNLTKANHTVTHLLQAALRQVLGTHVKQAGSMVEADRMRFDFSHFEAMNGAQIEEVENIVNTKIWENLPVSVSIMPLKEALATGAMAEFGEKYEDTVRVIRAGDFSTELCGGTHVDNTGKIGVFKILKESSPGAGVRRIEGVTLKSVLDRFNQMNETLETHVALLGVPEKDAAAKIAALQEKNRELEAALAKHAEAELATVAAAMLDEGRDVNGIFVLAKDLGSLGADAMKLLADMIRERNASSAVFFASRADDKAILLCAATKAAVDRGIDCGAVIKAIAPVVGGGGGGRKDMAQAGGKNPAAIAEAVSAAGIKLGESVK